LGGAVSHSEAIMTDLPSSARVVIIGGGIMGCSVAYHLAKLGWTDVILLERKKLTSGTTFHAAGLVGQLRASANITQLLCYSVALYDRLEAETGQATGWKRNGGLRLACNAERWTEVRRQATTARSFGLEMHLLSPDEAQRLWPAMTVDDVVGAAFLPTDGQANPSDIAMALARGARQGGVTIIEDVAVTGFRIDRGAVRAVETSQDTIVCDAVINCAGQWARAVGALAGVNVPLVSLQHQYLVTERIDGLPSDLPTLRDPDRLTYYKEEVGGLVMGGYEPDPLDWAKDGIPEGFHWTLLDADWDHFQPMMELALGRVPALQTAGIKQLVNGPESFTPDGSFILGEAPECRGFFVGAGFNAYGIAAGGGAGMALAEWVAHREPSMDLWPVDIRRFGRPHADPDWVRRRTREAYGRHYTMAWPFEEAQTGRPLRRSPLYDRLAAQGAVFGEKLGWERPNWFAAAGEPAEDRYTYGRPGWLEAVGREHRLVREAVGLFDQTSFAKYLVVGRDAEAALSWLCANDVARPPGAVVYTQMLNRHGGIECDLTVARLAQDEFYVVTGTGFATHDLDWMRRNLPPDAAASIVDVTSAHAVLSLMGPHARDVLAAVTEDDVSNVSFPFATCRRLVLAGTLVLALRLTYVGELGWELHVPVESACVVYEALIEAGKMHGIGDCGYRAIESLRLEKGYRAWGSDIGPDHTPFMAGLGWAVKLRGDRPFLGREALIAQRSRPLPRLLAGFTVDDPDAVLLGRETIHRNGARAGWLTSAGFGYTIGKSIGYGYVRNEAGVDAAYVMDGDYRLEVAGELVPATPFLRPLWDPASERVKR
jgi:sarcosine dehydrogenase